MKIESWTAMIVGFVIGFLASAALYIQLGFQISGERVGYLSEDDGVCYGAAIELVTVRKTSYTVKCTDGRETRFRQ